MKQVSLILCVILFMHYLNSVQEKLRPREQSASIYGKICLADGSLIPGALVTLTGPGNKKRTTLSSDKGRYRFLDLTPGNYKLKAEFLGLKTVVKRDISLKAGENLSLDLTLQISAIKEKVVVCGKIKPTTNIQSCVSVLASPNQSETRYVGVFNTEEYMYINENTFKITTSSPLSTFSIDVDTASYANCRRFINQNRLPPKDAVRIEEFINYFTYDYPQPEGDTPFSINSEVSHCPWNSKHLLVHLGLQGKKIEKKERVPSNLVFLLDVSGSMDHPLKLPLLKSAYKLLVSELSQEDRIAIVVYAGAAGLVLPSTPGKQKEKIIKAIDRLYADGGTAGSEGIKLAYQVAQENFIKKGNNRIILATDGDFNIGISSTGELIRLIEEKREKGIFLTALGFGMGNYKDSRLEQLADKGNGNYFYIDSLLEAKKVFINELGSTLFAIAKDVKIQVEFNPAKVLAYKLIGYENRLLEAEDFDNDKKDAGELGAGHSVTALYEIIPRNSKEKIHKPIKLKYQHNKIPAHAYKNKELMTVNLRYKKPDGKKSRLISITVKDKIRSLKKVSDNFRFSAAVAEFGLLLRDSQHKAKSSYKHVLDQAKDSKGRDQFGYRAEFIRLVERCQQIDKNE